jgi:hypothetical protein
VDDLLSQRHEEGEGDLGTKGAAHLGDAEFGSSTYYLYGNLDVDRLAESSGDPDGAIEAAAAFVKASITATPSGKSNGMASYEVPAIVIVEIGRERRPLSYLSAFEAPMRPSDVKSMTSVAVERLLKHIAKCDGFQGEASLQRFYLSLEPELELPSAKCPEDSKEKEAEIIQEVRVKNVQELIEKVQSALEATTNAGTLLGGG